MKSVFVISMGVTLLGTAQAAEDPFAAYHSAVGEQLSEMLQRAGNDGPAAAYDGPPRQVIREQPRPILDQTTGLAPRYSGGGAAHLEPALARLQRLRPELDPILQREGVPRELAAVVLVESAARADALSPRQARGLWQLMPDTARQYGLHVGHNHDGRLDIRTATQAAARYLRDLYGMFQDWPLALAAYNAGQNAVANALQRTGATSFWELSSNRNLPQETRNYVPAVLAAMRLIRAGAGSAAPDTVRAEFSPWVYATTSAAE